MEASIDQARTRDVTEIIEEHVGANMGIQIPLLVIDRRAISVMSTCLPNP